MSYGIIRIEKYSKGSVKGIQIHDQREKDFSHSNLDIDFSKSDLNFDLINKGNINYTKKVNEIIGQLNLKRAVRKDAIVMCQCLVTSNKSFFENMSFEDQKNFFQKSFNFIADRYGLENVISATLHLDEATPHLHINFVPVTSDGRLCAKDLFKKQDLFKLHDDFYIFNKKNGYGLERGESKNEFQKHLTTEEFKIKKQEEDLDIKQNNLTKLDKKIKDEISNAAKILENYDDLKVFTPEKVAFQKDKLKINKNDYEKLYALAKIGVLKNHTENELNDLKFDYSLLGKKYSELEEQIKTSISRKLKQAQEEQNRYNLQQREINSLKTQNNELNDTLKLVSEFLDEKDLIIECNNYLKEIEEQRNLNKNVSEKSNDWDMEL